MKIPSINTTTIKQTIQNHKKNALMAMAALPMVASLESCCPLFYNTCPPPTYYPHYHYVPTPQPMPRPIPYHHHHHHHCGVDNSNKALDIKNA